MNSTAGLTRRAGRSSTQTNGDITDRVRETAQSYAEEQLERRQLDRTLKRVISVGWVIVGFIVARQASLLDVLSNSELYTRWAFQLGALATVAVIGIYIEIRWLRGWRTGDSRPMNFARWQERYPTAIPLATGAGCVAATAWIIAFWPDWSGWTIPVLSMLTVGLGAAADLLIV
ncbi:hypothetical protein BDF19DRAFT_436993 [Syncephalis fuscata]|nr:hypothetical protein BDF19DRAFT_436993 [Syncephalis fuscata]